LSNECFHLFSEIVRIAGTDKYDYQSTLTAAIYNGSDLVYGHIGDGGIVALGSFGDYYQITKPQKGDNWNETKTLYNHPSEWQFGVFNEPIVAFFMATDGVYDVFCPPVFQNKDIPPIWISMARAFIDNTLIKIRTSKGFNNLQEDLPKKLEQSKFSEVDDDKTLVCIINTDVEPYQKEDDYYAEPDWVKINSECSRKAYGINDDITANKVESDVLANEQTDIETTDLPYIDVI
jgi:serine/threonine protein phosphatase PrpC